MMHIDEEQVQRLLHGELTQPVDTSVREHLAACAACRERVAEGKREEEEVYALLRHLDHPPPRVDANAVAARAGASEFAWGRWAAGFLLVMGLAGAAYAAPGSPLPAVVETVLEWVGGGRDQDPSTLAPAPAQTRDPALAGIAIAAGEELLILFTSPQTDGQVHVSLTDGTEVEVSALNGAATFTSDVDRLVINNQGSTATFEIRIPRAAPRVEIRLGGDRIFLKEGARVTTEKSAEAPGRYILPLTRSGS